MEGRRHTNEINNSIRNTKRASSLNTTAQLNDLSPERLRARCITIRRISLSLQLRKVLGRKTDEARADILSNQICRRPVLSLDGNLDLQLASPKIEIQELVAALRRGALHGRRFSGLGLVADYGAAARIVLGDLVKARDAEINLALADECGDVGGGEENKGDGEVLDERDVEAVFAAELDVGSFEEV